jgi:hypothetical protein
MRLRGMMGCPQKAVERRKKITTPVLQNGDPALRFFSRWKRLQRRFFTT